MNSITFCNFSGIDFFYSNYKFTDIKDSTTIDQKSWKLKYVRNWNVAEKQKANQN